MSTKPGKQPIEIYKIKGKQYISLNDLIRWLKKNQPHCDENISVHWLIKEFVSLKNKN